MNKEEFIMRLQHALASGMPGGQVDGHVRYYREYIDSEIHKGKTEEEVLSQLGDPRLLAKSIIEANKRAGAAYGSNRDYDEEVAGDVQEDSSNDRTNRIRRVMLPGWLVMLIIVVIAMLVVGVVSSLLYLFAPVIMAGLIVLLVIKVIQGNRR